MDNTEHIIQELESEKWEMAQEIERLREQERKMTNHAIARMEETERLREERTRLREALKQIAERRTPYGQLPRLIETAWAEKIARAALKGTPK